MKLFTAICYDSKLLGHFLKHYHDPGVTEFFIASAAEFTNDVRGFSNSFNIRLFETLNVEDSNFGGTAAVTEMRRTCQAQDEWVIIVDLDEFIEFQEAILDTISRANQENTNVVRAIYYDRFTVDGNLPEIGPETDLPRLFPVKARFVANVMGGCDHKGIFVKGHLVSAMAHHEFLDEEVSSQLLEIAHYRWRRGSIDQLRIQTRRLEEKGVPYAVEYQRALDCYDQYGKFVWQNFGGELMTGVDGGEGGTGAIPENSPGAHATDMAQRDLETALQTSQRPELLRELAGISRQAFGFYTSHFPHTINYPWIAARLEMLCPPSRVLDIGAGVSPLPIWLAGRGLKVDCVDNHSIMRVLPSNNDWNEWGFFDYGQVHPNLDSHHCAVSELKPTCAYDAIYSVSVVAHMAGTVRVDAFSRSGEWLRAGGALLLAIDLIPASDFLWTYSGGIEVERPVEHGTIGTVLSELIHLGFRVDESTVIRTVPNSRTDLLLIRCTRT